MVILGSNDNEPADTATIDLELNELHVAIMELVGPATAQALLLARYQALRRIGREVVQMDEGDVISQKPTREEERIMTFNVSVVSALEDIFSWMCVSCLTGSTTIHSR